MNSILLIVTKNTAVLDFALPLLLKIRREAPGSKVAVLYAAINKRSILRGALFYSAMLQKNGIPEWDLADFLGMPLSLCRGLLRFALRRARKDSLGTERYLRFVPLGTILLKILRRTEKTLDRVLAGMVQYDHMLSDFSPDVILLDHTVNITPARRSLLRCLKSRRQRTILLPHAPHHSSTTAFTPFEEDGEPLPDFCEYWMPFRDDRTWEAPGLPAGRLPEKQSHTNSRSKRCGVILSGDEGCATSCHGSSPLTMTRCVTLTRNWYQFRYVGYPGLDSDWIKEMRGLSPEGLTPWREHSSSEVLNSPLTCLFLIRPFKPKGHPDIPSFFSYRYEEFRALLHAVEEAIRRSRIPVELIVKPHPSNNFRETGEIFNTSSIARWRITDEPISALLPDIDCVLSLYSTTLLTPAIAGIPTMLLHSSAQDEVHRTPEFRALYTGLHFYLPDPAALPERFPEFLEAARKRRDGYTIKGTPWEMDAAHVRSFFPDGASKRCLEQLLRP